MNIIKTSIGDSDFVNFIFLLVNIKSKLVSQIRNVTKLCESKENVNPSFKNSITVIHFTSPFSVHYQLRDQNLVEIKPTVVLEVIILLLEQKVPFSQPFQREKNSIEIFPTVVTFVNSYSFKAQIEEPKIFLNLVGLIISDLLLPSTAYVRLIDSPNV